MSWDIELDTSSYRPRHQTTSMFRMEEQRPFDPSVISMRFATPTPRTTPHQTPQSRARVNPMAFAAAYDEEDEKMSLIPRRGGGSNVPYMTIFALGAVILALITFMGVMYYQFTASVSEARDLSRPYIMEAVNHTLAVLANLDHGTADAHRVVDDVHALSGAAVPALQHALNQSAAIVDRLERLARNPVLQLSLANSPSG